MGATRVKLCGMFRDEDIVTINVVRPDFVGFIIDFPKSHRSLGQERLRALSAQVDEGITRVGVFVDEPYEQVAALLNAGVIDIAQLHGREDEAYIDGLRALSDAPLWQAFRIRKANDVERALQSTADMVLLDAGQGSGETFDWSLIEDFGSHRPFILAGGLTPQNVAQAVRDLHPWGADMSSSLETDKIKDSDKMAAAVAAVRSAQ